MSEKDSADGVQAGGAETVKRVGETEYYPYTSDFTGQGGQNVSRTFFFREPGRTHVVQLSKAGQGKSYDVQRNIMLQLVHPDERAELDELFGAKPLLVVAFADEVFKRAGMGSVYAGA